MSFVDRLAEMLYRGFNMDGLIVVSRRYKVNPALFSSNTGSQYSVSLVNSIAAISMVFPAIICICTTSSSKS